MIYRKSVKIQNRFCFSCETWEFQINSFIYLIYTEFFFPERNTDFFCFSQLLFTEYNYKANFQVSVSYLFFITFVLIVTTMQILPHYENFSQISINLLSLDSNLGYATRCRWSLEKTAIYGLCYPAHKRLQSELVLIYFRRWVYYRGRIFLGTIT